jgi:pimeloyl-ACP methyl ester carboxylesterase
MQGWKTLIFVAGLAGALCMPSMSSARTDSLSTQPRLETRTIKDGLGRSVTYHIAQPSQPAPLLLMIQGSGCSKLIKGEGTNTYSTLFNFLPFASEGRFAVMAVEKPFSDKESSGGTAESCNAAFNDDFTAERWLVALHSAVKDARGHANLKTDRMLIFGISEGAVMASLLAGRDPSVTDVISIGGSGTTQLFDFLASSYSTCFDRSRCIADVERTFAEIQSDPNSSIRFAWGHPYRRWTSFFAVDPSQELLRSRARIYLAFGTSDSSTPPLSQEILVAKLLAANRDITVRRVPNADHSLIGPGGSISDLDREYRLALEWFWAGDRPSPQSQK